MTQRFFIIGTDTGVGKTWIMACIYSGFIQRNIRCLPYKPIQTGTDQGDDDTAFYFKATGRSPAQACPPVYCFGPPTSPHLAGRMAGVTISIGHICGHIDSIEKDISVLLLEGAGGILTPINETESILDLVKATRAMPILVTRSGLGTLNHTALTLRELERAQLRPAAIIVNDTEPIHNLTVKMIRDDNIVRINQLAQGIPVFHIPHTTTVDTESTQIAGAMLVDVLTQTPQYDPNTHCD